MFKAYLALGVATLFAGCAAVPETQSLVYEPQEGTTLLPGASDAVVNVAIQDVREDKRRISNKRHNWGFDMASVYSEEPVEDVVKLAIENELEARGFKLGGAASTVSVNGNIVELYSNLHMYSGFWSGKTVADSTIQIEILSKAGESIYLREISVNPEHTGVLYQSSYNLARPVEMAIEETLDVLFEDQTFINALLQTSG